MAHISKIIVLALFLVHAGQLTAQKQAQGSQDSIVKNLKISAFPVAFYTPETAFGFGGIGIANFWLKEEQKETRPSSVQLGLSYTTKSQLLLYMPFEFYKKNERWRLLGELGFYKYFYNFYGVGVDSREEDEETYEVTFPRARLALMRDIWPNFYIGVGYEFDNFSSLKIEEGGILEASDVPGKRDGTLSNIGIRVFYDTRDNVFYPTEGMYIQGNLFTSSKILGASFKYSKFELDSRYYQKVGKKQVIAANLFLGGSSKNTPFYDLFYLGSKRTRGINNRRFQDTSELSMVLEYRFPIAGRFGGAVFGSSGTVTPTLNEAFSSAYKNAGGVGIRYIINKRDGVRIRADYGMSSEGGNFYFTIKEAF
ncbi:BamA/TamA family outer membrane protein [Zobellia galactanivorans]|uniref:Bacterial surface antigen n=1 Tax=Zobellia galactanivorans (strain DSM 12802 / CCUG 47099 / CIP 106680 / NCIMB 13871 / Dsij) TaxID=63186 RepID=G0L085_ZOBGA|nr:BamA/TamA family outer membrane protein [Zobellia galactanivorans]CAZ94188.1 Bacterial surface antigen [Zobellia galactanivorans]